MTPITRVASVTRFSASVWPEMRMARACATRGGVTTPTVRGTAWGCSTEAGFGASSFSALPTDENSPDATQPANPMSTARAATL